MDNNTTIPADNTYKSYMQKKLGLSENAFKPVDPNLHPDSDELKAGIKHEGEHSSDPRIARIIALHHLKEDPRYYSRLAKCDLKESIGIFIRTSANAEQSDSTKTSAKTGGLAPISVSRPNSTGKIEGTPQLSSDSPKDSISSPMDSSAEVNEFHEPNDSAYKKLEAKNVTDLRQLIQAAVECKDSEDSPEDVASAVIKIAREKLNKDLTQKHSYLVSTITELWS